MYRMISSLLLSIIFISMVVVGCSSGKGNPVTPEKEVGEMTNLPILSLTDAGEASNGLGILGAYELTINPDKMSAELISMRTPTIGESYIVSGIAFFTIAPCVDCLKIVGFDLVGGNIALKFSIKHPFDAGDLGLPPTAKNRRDLDVFDLAMVIKPAAATPTNYPLMGASIYSNVVANASGYTKELSNVITDNAALPFVLVVDDSLGTTSTWNKFSMGASKEFQVAFKLTPGTPLKFDMYLTMGYGASAKRPDRLTPKYFNPEFNRKAAWKVEAESLSEWVDNNATTPVNVGVKVYDWQIGATVYGTPADFANAPTNNVYAMSEVASVSVEIPGMNSTLPSVTTADSGKGTPSDPLIFTVPIANQNLLPVGEYPGIVKVLDQRPCLTAADGRDIIIDTPDGIALNNCAMPEYATYQTFEAAVVGPCTGFCSVKRAGGTGDDIGDDITTLSDNSTVTTGTFEDSATFGQGELNQTILNSAGDADIFIARYNPNGKLSWAKRAGGLGYDFGNGLTTLSDNSTVVTGGFWSSATFGSGESNQTILTASYWDIFIARYNTYGTLSWAKRAGGSGAEAGNGITTLSGNSTVVIGDFDGSATFGPGEPNQTILTSAGEDDIFIARYNSDGTLSWAKRAGGLDWDTGLGITALSDDSTIVTGSFEGSATFGQGEPNQTTLTSDGYSDFFIARYNPDGTLSWAKHAGGSNIDKGYGITALSDNSTVVTGVFWSSATFGSGELNQTILTPAGEDDIFIARYNSDGTLSWAKRAGGTDYDLGSKIKTLSDNSIVVTGYFCGLATFGASEPNQTVLISAGSDYSDIFVARYNPDGTLSWAKRAGGTDYCGDSGYGITTLSDDSTVVTGYFAGSATFGPSEPNETVLTSAGQHDIFIARYKY